ncbi:MAG: GxxExxY protein [Phycisphaerales bacterium JB063]
MDQRIEDSQINPVTEKVIGCAYAVSNTLGYGFLEKVYENALAFDLQDAGLKVRQQHPIQVRYHHRIVGDYIADLVVNDLVLVELKSAQAIADAHKAQCLNYLRATGLPVCLLINFGPSGVEIKRLRM